MNNQLKNLKCEPCSGGVAAMTKDEANEYLQHVDESWVLAANGKHIERRFRFKNFAKTMFFVNALAHLADQQGHHPDVSFGYKYFRVLFTTHEAGGLSINDFICAKQVDQLISSV
jgi:4a-hydroxytetrahydrobiopterin dehydratase